MTDLVQLIGVGDQCWPVESLETPNGENGDFYNQPG